MKFWSKFLFVLCFAATAGKLLAQSVYTAETRARLYAFGMASYVRPDYGDSLKNAGGTVGADLNLHRLTQRLEPGMEVRVLGSGGRLTRQYNYAAGPRLQYNWNKIQPYAEFLVGYGRITFERPLLTPQGFYVGDNALTLNAGGGIDYELNPHWAVRGDFLQQRWSISRAGDLKPWAISAGVRYRFLFKSAAYAN
ncbi:porin family protein [Terriglobus tenax]|uniref:porin family protein n=1 Tax=Terriglobus tenax TaxID=1111115 RepID=UPI0021E0F6BD|nr:porin family protein [Terriglobus tenax]